MYTNPGENFVMEESQKKNSNLVGLQVAAFFLKQFGAFTL